MSRFLLFALALGMVAWVAAGCTDYDLGPDDDSMPGDDDDDDDNDSDDDDSDDDDDDDTGYNPNDDDDDDDDDDDSVGEPIGRVLTILLTLNDMWMDQNVANQLLVNSVEWVTPFGMTDPKVLIIRDDEHSGEHPEDSENSLNWLLAAGYDATLIDEPGDGIVPADLTGYAVAMLSNPGHSPDDESTLEALYDFSTQGYGIIFQGDDMTHFDGGGFDMESLTRLHYIDNGTEYHGYDIDNDDGDLYEVELANFSHPVLDGIQGTIFLYGDDIDTSEPSNLDEVVLAYATVQGTNLPTKPAIAGYSVGGP